MGTIWRRENNSLPEDMVLWREDEEVAGVNHYLPAALAFVNGECKELLFESDSSNDCDSNAIRIIGKYTDQGVPKTAHIGFVSSDLARLIAVYAEGIVLLPQLTVIWQGDVKKDYLLIKFDIHQHRDAASAHQNSDSNIRTAYLPADYDQAFTWWCSRQQNGGQFPYVCPACGTMVPIRKRIVVSKRSCPKCNEEITLANIDFLLEGSEEDRQKVIAEVNRRRSLALQSRQPIKTRRKLSTEPMRARREMPIGKNGFGCSLLIAIGFSLFSVVLMTICLCSS